MRTDGDITKFCNIMTIEHKGKVETNTMEINSTMRKMNKYSAYMKIVKGD
jgi:hypothetical protein